VRPSHPQFDGIGREKGSGQNGRQQGCAKDYEDRPANVMTHNSSFGIKNRAGC
jgi:hypothetical protein